ncbi:hypothetical protein IQ251_00260 [Saccharopolyspora sp. HNM0983]|uniref:Uncharacterized protein n=1 Tax=Saccharopolyspora montiporae TaxID=2781240 RepID=A0A929B482_9PSEU|nr:hypothetical protein [Saccharopolyspora sp. HNM0983]MBE9372872.1 hypothetical protein [Saccharopolyspora sp. HNM0983]
MGARRDRPRISFEPTGPASGARKAVAFLLGSLLWVAAFWLGIVLLGHTHILRTLLVVTVLSWFFFGIALVCGIVMRRGQERHVPR